MIIYGKHAVFAALLNKNRRHKQLFITKNTEDKLPKHIKLPSVKISITSNKHLDDLTQSDSHQGIALETSRIFKENLLDLNDIIEKDIAHILILDHLEDPQNVGNIIRSAAAFNTDAIILTRNRSVKETPSLIKAACGATEIIPIFVISNIMNMIKDLKKYNFWILGLDANAKYDINTFDIPKKSVSIIGAEQSGIQKLHKNHCDWLIKIPISEKVESLNAATTAAIIMNRFSSIHNTIK